MVDVYNAFIMRDKHFEQNCKSPDLKKNSSQSRLLH